MRPCSNTTVSHFIATAAFVNEKFQCGEHLSNVRECVFSFSRLNAFAIITSTTVFFAIVAQQYLLRPMKLLFMFMFMFTLYVCGLNDLIKPQVEYEVKALITTVLISTAHMALFNNISYFNSSHVMQIQVQTKTKHSMPSTFHFSYIDTCYSKNSVNQLHIMCIFRVNQRQKNMEINEIKDVCFANFS